MTCCALHNFMLQVDGMSVEQDGNVGLFDIDESDGNVPFAIRRLQTGSEQRNYDSSGMGPGFIDDDDYNADNDDNMAQIECDDDFFQNITDEIDKNEINNVNQLSSNLMRDKLIKHFDILFHRNEVQWPKINCK